MLSVLAALLAFSGGASYRTKYPLPNLQATSGWGVNIHFTDERPAEVAKIAAAGFHWVRMDFFWSAIEKSRGQYDFSAYDRLQTSLHKSGIRPVFILDYGNDLYESGSPRSPESREAFCRFVAEAVKHYRHQGVLWEMWNEPNIFFWKPKPDVQQYVALALQVGETIRKVAPDEWYIGPATSGFDWNFLKGCIDAGLLKYWDAVSVHPYRGDAPETAAADWLKLRQMIDAGAPNGHRIPMFSGEWGYSTASNGIDPDRQAMYITRQYLTNLLCGAPLSIYYDWKEDGRNPTEPEHHFGTVTPDLEPKPAYEAAASLSKALQGYTFRRRLSQASPEDYLLEFRKRGSILYVAWTSSRDRTNVIALPFKRTEPAQTFNERPRVVGP